MIFFLICLSWAALILAVAPALLAARNLALYRPPERPGTRHAVSVLIPARNEAANIGHALAAVLENEDVALDVVVLDDQSTDGTGEIVQTIASRDPRVRLAAAPSLPPGWSGKQHACWALSALAREDLLVFVDADVRLAPDSLGRMAEFMARRPGIGLASGVPAQVTGSLSERLLISLIPFLLLSYLPIALMRRSPHPGFGAGCGQLFIARAAAYRQVGGHSAIRRSLHDGVTLPRAFRRAGFMTDLFDAAPVARCRMYRGWSELLPGLSKNATEGLATLAGLPVWMVLLGLGQALPPLLIIVDILAGTGVSGWLPAAIAGVVSIALRVWMHRRFGSTLMGAVAHAVGVGLLLFVQWRALIRAGRGRAESWRGRSYVAGS